MNTNNPTEEALDLDLTLQMIRTAIRQTRALNRKIGLCGQAASDDPAFCEFLIEQDIDSISFNPDALLTGIENIHRAETRHPTHFQENTECTLAAHHAMDYDAEE